MQRKTITLTEQQEQWIKTQVNQGHYGNDSEYIRDLLRKEMQKQDAEFQLKNLIDEAEASGQSDKTPHQIWQQALNNTNH